MFSLQSDNPPNTRHDRKIVGKGRFLIGRGSMVYTVGEGGGEYSLVAYIPFQRGGEGLGAQALYEGHGHTVHVRDK